MDGYGPDTQDVDGQSWNGRKVDEQFVEIEGADGQHWPGIMKDDLVSLYKSHRRCVALLLKKGGASKDHGIRYEKKTTWKGLVL